MVKADRLEIYSVAFYHKETERVVMQFAVIFNKDKLVIVEV